MITVLHRGGYAPMITILHRGGGALGTPKSDYVICARPLIHCKAPMINYLILDSDVTCIALNHRFDIILVY